MIFASITKNKNQNKPIQNKLRQSNKTKKNYTLVSGNAGDEKNLHLGGRKKKSI